MPCARATSETTPLRTHLRLAVLAQWIRTGLALARGAATGGGLVAGAVALWRVAQAVRLAMRLAQILADAERARAAGPGSVERDIAPCPAPAGPLGVRPSNADALRRALVELAGAISDALGLAAPHRPMFVAASGARAVPACPRPGLRGKPPGGRRPRRRRWRAPQALEKTPPPIAAPAIGRLPLL